MAKITKEVVKRIKLVIQAGQAKPAPPVGPAIGAAGLNIMEFCKSFNDATADRQGPVPVYVNVYKDKTFTFVTKQSNTSYLIKDALKLKSGSQKPGFDVAGKITNQQLEDIAKVKMVDFNTDDIEQAKKIVAGQAISMGIEVEEAA